MSNTPRTENYKAQGRVWVPLGIFEDLERKNAHLREVAEAARCIRHWHDAANGGMIVSSEHVRLLWASLDRLDASA